jgi:hypothetical protein
MSPVRHQPSQASRVSRPRRGAHLVRPGHQQQPFPADERPASLRIGDIFGDARQRASDSAGACEPVPAASGTFTATTGAIPAAVALIRSTPNSP